MTCITVETRLACRTVARVLPVRDHKKVIKYLQNK